jgi:hypothetical protein
MVEDQHINSNIMIEEGKYPAIISLDPWGLSDPAEDDLIPNPALESASLEECVSRFWLEIIICIPNEGPVPFMSMSQVIFGRENLVVKLGTVDQVNDIMACVECPELMTHRLPSVRNYTPDRGDWLHAATDNSNWVRGYAVTSGC